MSGIVVLILRILLAAALYGFIFWVVFTLWKELKTQTQILAAKKVPILSIQPLDFSQAEPSRFDQTEIILGRDPACTYVISDETVSARHSRFAFRHNQWWVEDLGSTNGTFLNGDPITTQTVIVSGDEVRCGQEAFRIEIAKNPA